MENQFNENLYNFEINDFGVKDENGEILVGEKLNQYLKMKMESMEFIEEVPEVGDAIILRNTNTIVVVEENNGVPFKYKGRSSFSDNLICFNQENIQEIISSKINKSL